jgi:beta-N-acetylhexosaminidase
VTKLVALLLGVGLTAASASSSQTGTTPPTLKQLVGQHLVVRMKGTTPSGSLLGRVRRGEVGGVIVFGGNIASTAGLRRALAALQRAARAGGQPPLLTMVDQEGGRVRRLPAGPPSLSPAAVGASGSVAVARRQGLRTGAFLRDVGLNVNLAPVLDVPESDDSFLAERAYGTRPALVAKVGAAFVSGMQRRGVAATAKHFPGIGLAPRNTDRAPVSVRLTRAELERGLLPFQTAIGREVRMVMVSNASYPALDSTRAPALFSRAIVTQLLRDELGFDGVVITDSLQAPAPSARRDGPILALQAGVDLLLHTGSERSSGDLYRQVLRAARAGELSRADIVRSYERVQALKRRL